MPLNSLAAPYYLSDLERFEQGDILRDVTLVEWAEVSGSDLEIRERVLPYCVVLSQDCDLEHDFNNRADQARKDCDKFLQSVLLCPAYPAPTFREGAHLSAENLPMSRISSEAWKKLSQNNTTRYHFLAGNADMQIPDLVVDFKHYLTAPRDVLYRKAYHDRRLATIEIVYRDNLSGRFAHYLSRIGLPELSVA